MSSTGPYRESQKSEDTFRLTFKIHLKSGKELAYSRPGVESHWAQNVITEEMMKFFVLDGNANPVHQRTSMVTLTVLNTDSVVKAEYVDPQEIDHFETSKVNERMEREHNETLAKSHIERVRSRAGFT